MNPNYAWHFTGPKLRDGRPIPPVGEWLVHEGPIEWCKSGLYACRHPMDALENAPGNFLHLVEVADIHEEREDKLVCRRRRIVGSMDATEMLRYYARMQALSVVHLCDPCPEDVVLDWLMTGDETLREAASASARASAWANRASAWANRARAWAWTSVRDSAWASASANRACALGSAWASASANRACALGSASASSWASVRDDFKSMVEECFEDYLR